MPSFRKKMAIQKKPKLEKVRVHRETYAERNARFEKLRFYINKGIRIYNEILPSFEPLSEEQKICMDKIMSLTYELEIVRNGTNEECEEVYDKYGEYIH